MIFNWRNLTTATCVGLTVLLSANIQAQNAASEAAAAVLKDGLQRIGLAEILSFTALSNIRSQAVMQRIGLHRRRDLDFAHPGLAADHPLRPHIVWSTRSA